MSETGAPKVSIGLPVYNGARYLAEAIESVLAQDFEDFELILSDNASTDETPDICKSFAAADPRVKYVRHPRNIGAAKNHNYTFLAASGEFFQWFAHDDVLGPQFLSLCLSEYERRDAEPMLVYPKFEFIDENSNILDRPKRTVVATAENASARLVQTLDSIGAMIEVYGLFRKASLAKTRLVGSYVSSDLFFLAECALIGPIVCAEGEPQFFRRMHGGSSRQANITDETVLQWFDPDAAVSRPAGWRARSYNYYLQSGVEEYMKAVLLVRDIPFSQRAGAFGALLARRIRKKFRPRRKPVRKYSRSKP
ncbi:glycosyltransferase [Leisingera aquaemixtae]|uniref:glycosyltransferase family 2 protein n=1 Tax=Leisingera aquaemixtae TaxID=1396826 RepID=UPI001C972679|nr:glycosyltransferase family 2 protein [Leisingera aquaemixtae]MBY6069551.1 glycosyltransferase [Leisingera aquaemixtae]